MNGDGTSYVMRLQARSCELPPSMETNDAMSLPTTVAQSVPLPFFEFHTEQLPPCDQFAAWRGSFSSMLELKKIDHAATTFRGRQKVWDLGCLLLAELSTDALSFASLPEHFHRDPIDHWIITLVTTGSSRTEVQGQQFSGAAGDVQIHSLGKPFTGDITRSDLLMLFVPRDFSIEAAAVLGQAEFSVLKNGLGRLFGNFLRDVVKQLPTLTVGDGPGLVAATRAMVLACVAPSPDRIHAAATPIATTLLDRARRLIHARLLDPKLDSELIRRELGISRTRLYNLFEPFGGVMHFIQHRRLIDAHRALTDLEDRRLIFQIAEERGFSDGAEFSRAFKRAFGYRPSDVRRHGRNEATAQTCPISSPAQDRLNHVLRRLKG
jgi:AraC-like DNA-binding protein